MGIKITDKRLFPRTRVLTEREVFADWSDEVYEDVSKRVEKGMAWLDEHKPDWFDVFAREGFEVLDTEKGRALSATVFDIQEPLSCVLGITLGRYNNVCYEHGLTMNDSADLGFNLINRLDSQFIKFDSGNIGIEEITGVEPRTQYDTTDDTSEENDQQAWGRLQRMWTYKVEAELGIEHIETLV